MAGYQPAPGPQNPQAYGGHVGPNYLKYGEQQGYIYYAPQDRYYTDPNYAKKYAQEHGYGPPAPPGLGQTVLPIAAAGGALALGQSLGKDPGGFFSGIGNLFGFGSKTPAAGGAAVAPTSAAGSSLPGLLGFGQTGGADAFSATGADAAAGNYVANALGGGASGTTADAAIDAPGLLGTAAPYLGLGGAGLGAYGLYEGIKNHSMGQSALSGAGLGAGLAAASPLLLGGGPVGWGLLGLSALGGGAGGALLESLLGHETTRELAQKHTSDLQGEGANDPAWQNYVSGMRGQYNAPPPDPSHPYHGGQYGTWDEYKQAGLDPNDLEGVYGNLNTFGPQWAHYSPQQQHDITQGLINAGLYDSSKGEVVVTDPNRAHEIATNILAGKK